MTNEELKSCPFCGSPYANKPEIKSYYNGYSGILYFVKCTHYFASSDHLETEEEALLAWNKRVVND